MLPTLVDGLPDRAGWVFEPKWDGWRCLAVKPSIKDSASLTPLAA